MMLSPCILCGGWSISGVNVCSRCARRLCTIILVIVSAALVLAVGALALWAVTH